MKIYSYIIIILVILLSISCRDEQDRPVESKDLIVSDDLQVSLWAESPLFYNPTGMDVDHKGRIWVTEAVNYRTFKEHADSTLRHEKGDRVIILEDTNGDGTADKSTVFVQDKDLHAPLGIAVIGNKVIVSSSPSLIIYTDTNGDDKADKKEVFLTGFGGYDHDHSLHSAIAGPDGRWYFNAGNSGPHIVEDKNGWVLRAGSLYNGGTPYAVGNEPGLISDDGRIWVGGLALSINPDGTDLRVFAHNFRNCYEITVDSYGNVWQNDNDDQVSTCRTTWVMENGNAGYASNDGSRSWQADRRPGQNNFTAHWHQEDPGVMPAGDNTGAGAPTGMTIYESDALGVQYRGMLLSADAGRNLIYGYKPIAEGAGFNLSDKIIFATSVEESTKDYRWDDTNIDSTKRFRPSDVTIGTDGAIYIADWYDDIVGGHAMLDTSGYGRIYRISPKGNKLSNPEINLNIMDGQIKAFLNPAMNVRNLGFNKLRARGEKAIPQINEIIEKGNNPYHSARAIWLMGYLGDKGIENVINLLNDEKEEIRLVAYRTLRQVSADRLLEYSLRMSKDPSPAIKREVAIAMRDVPLEKCKSIIINILEDFDGGDRWYLEALGTALDGKESEFYKYIIEKYGADPMNWSDAIFDLVWRIHPEAASSAFMKVGLNDDLSIDKRKKALVGLGFISSKKAAEKMMQIKRRSKNKSIKEDANWWLNFRSTNEWASYYSIDKEEETISPEILAWEKQLFSNDVTEEAKINIVQNLAQDADGGKILLKYASRNWLSDSLRKVASEFIFSNPDQSVRVFASEYFNNPGKDRNYNIPEILSIRGDEVNGVKAFKKYCSSCHMVQDTGKDIGPDLTSIGNKLGKTALLDAIINPNADIVFGYESWKVTTKGGKTIYGFIQSDGEYVTIKDPINKVTTIKSTEILDRQPMPSMMPSPSSLGMDEQELSDISAYLLAIE